MIDLRHVDSIDRPLHSVQAGRQIMKARYGQVSRKPYYRAAIALLFYEIGGFVHQGDLVVHYRLHGKPKRPIRKPERRARAKVSGTA